MLSRMKPLVPVYDELTGELWRAGVPIVAGSDTPNPLVFPGSSLHEELELLVGAGLTPLAALLAATREAARFRRQLDSQGTVEAGKVADMVLLDANPLEDIRNTRKIAGVVLAGRYLDRAALDGLLEESAAAAAREPEGDGQEPHA
jgi:imidazolonepropionase-like amidohydrolase